jgi:DNA-binding NarL/FixJ family response regulator
VLEPADKKIRILLLDDHTSFRQDLVKLLSTQPDLDLPVDAFPKRPKALTAREIEVLRLLVEGHANKQISHELGCSESSVKGILQQLFQKSGTRTRSPARSRNLGAIPRSDLITPTRALGREGDRNALQPRCIPSHLSLLSTTYA